MLFSMKFPVLACAALAMARGLLASAPPGSKVSSTRPRAFAFKKVKQNPRNLPRSAHSRKRSNTVLQRLDNLDFLYYANVSLGTPPQSLRLHLDTGSSDVWVESATSDLCTSKNNPCATTGTFNAAYSSTFKNISNDFSISYVDGEFADGDYGSDVFHLGDVNVTGLQFGIGLQVTSTEGIMGIGFNRNEVQVQRLRKNPYRNLIDLMADENIIRSRAYSLWLNDLGRYATGIANMKCPLISTEASTGEILFGGVDTAKFSGNLTTLPIDKRSGENEAREFMITLTSVSLTDESGKSLTVTEPDFAIAVLLDTGSSYTYLPTDLAEQLANQVGAQLNEQIGVPIVPCDVRDYNGTINYGFSGATINVPLNELAVDAYQDDGSPATFSDGTLLCYFGILDSGSETSVLGDTFLRSAYVVFDLDNEEISLGKTLYNVIGSDILEIGAGKNSVPDAIVAKNPVTLAPTETGMGRTNNMPYASGTLTRTAGGFCTTTAGPRSSASPNARPVNFLLLMLASVLCFS